MKVKIFKIIFFLFTSNIIFSQLVVEDINLSKKLDETSGLEIINKQLVTINDSGNDPVLFYINESGNILDERKLNCCKNNDWESLAADSDYVYIADFGNNYDTRKNLSIIKIPIDKSSNENPK